MGHGLFRNISMGNVTLKGLFYWSLWQNKDIKLIFSCGKERWGLQIREAFLKELQKNHNVESTNTMSETKSIL